MDCPLCESQANCEVHDAPENVEETTHTNPAAMCGSTTPGNVETQT